MRIVFDLTPLYDHLTGVERYNLNISKSLILQHPEDQYILLFKNEIHLAFAEIVKQENVRYKILPECNKFVFIQWRLYNAVRNIKADYYIFLSFTSPILFSRPGIINAIHDLTCWDCPETIPKKMVWYYRLTYEVAAKKSWKVVTVSKFSQKQICDRYSLSKDKVPVIYDGLTDSFRKPKPVEEDIFSKYHLPRSYILSLSTIEPRKNLQLLINAYCELLKEGNQLPDLVLAGRKGWKIEEITSVINNDVKRKIHFTGFIDDDDLPYIYGGALLFVFPSKYEGFGLPIIEAMSQETLVLSSDAASLPEVCGSAGFTFRSNDIVDLKSKIIDILHLGNLEKKRNVDAAKKNAFAFDWNNESEKLHELMVSK